jgi:N-acetylated-alpha-linked acidic dipeptidase
MGTVWAALLLSCNGWSDDRLLGFSDADSDAQRAREASYDALLDPADLERWMRALSERPHHVGSAHGQANVDYLAGLFEQWGYQVQLARYEVLFPTPKRRRLRLLEPTSFEASLGETPLADDPSTASTEVLPPYNAFSPDGDVTAQLVFVNYGVQEDYEQLERFGIEVSGKVVIARYGRAWRGIKPKLAADHGAIGALIYSDPADDGYARGEVYPRGAFKHPSGVQRGSVMELPVFAGDVLTPGVAATARARRLDIADSPAIAKIPVLPISYADAQPLLEALEGPVAPADWRGALPITYRLGPGPARVRLEVEFNWDRVQARNVIATLPGRVTQDEWIMRGNHHDAWNHGAGDPISGLVALLAEARAVAAQSPRPARTVVYAAWDAEEPGLMGSTEWVEEHARELTRKAVVYFNTDGSGRGFLRMGGSGTLQPFLQQIAADVVDPQTGVSVAARAAAWVKVYGSPEQQAELSERGTLRLAPLGSGSDYTPFLQHLGIASANLGFGGENAGGSYHSLYDTFAHYTRFGDPGFKYGIALARVAGRATLRMANAEILPFDFGALADNIASYVDEIAELADELREETVKRNGLIDDGSFKLALDPSEALGAPRREDAVPYLNLAPLHNAVAALTAASAHYKEAAAAGTLDARRRTQLNQLLFKSERTLLDERGLPERPWYRHQLYAPGYYTGYGAKTLPALREAIEQRQFDGVDEAVQRIAGTLGNLTQTIENATKLWQVDPGPQ